MEDARSAGGLAVNARSAYERGKSGLVSNKDKNERNRRKQKKTEETKKLKKLKMQKTKNIRKS